MIEASAIKGPHDPDTRRYEPVHLEAVLDVQGRKRRWLADRVGVSESLISHILAGRQTVDLHLGEAIAAAVGVPFSVLFALRESSETDAPPQEAA